MKTKLFFSIVLLSSVLQAYSQFTISPDGSAKFRVGGYLAGFTGTPSNTTNVSFGYKALNSPSTTQNFNVAFGNSALFSNTAGFCNTATGGAALYLNAGGYYNTASGFQSLYSNTSGYANTANGVTALYSNTTGYDNTATGTEALYSNTTGTGNSSFGRYSLPSNTTGSNNNALGDAALASSTTGSNNTAVGTWSLSANTTSSYNTAVGYYAAALNAGNLNNTIVIGYDAAATASNQVRIGNYQITSIGGYAGWSNISDGRVKKNIRADVPGLSFINGLHPVTYNLNLDAIDRLLKKDGKEDGKSLSPELAEINKKARDAKQKQVQTGFVAQDVEKTAKSIGYEFSGVDVDESGIYALRYAEFVVPLVKAVQELSDQNDRLQEQVTELKGLLYGLLEKEGKSVLKSPSDDASATGTADLAGSGAALYQNTPNPFREQTEIRYSLPGAVRSAQVCIFDMQGKMLKKLDAPAGGHMLIVRGSELKAGMYLYALIVDGKEVDTKRMVLTK